MTYFPKGLERIGGQPTNFIPKLWEGLILCKNINPAEAHGILAACLNERLMAIKRNPELKPKLHTFREDPYDRWQPGKLIHAVVNNRTPNRFQFLPTIPCVGTQKVQICHYSKEMYGNRPPDIQVDNIRMTPQAVELMAHNDGFERVEDFFAYFNTDFKGKIIHLTDLRY